MFEGNEFGREASEASSRMNWPPRDGESLDPGTTRGGGISRLRRADKDADVEELLFEVRGAVPKEFVDPITVFDRLVAAGLSQQRAEWHLGAERVTLDGRLVTDPRCPAPTGTRLVVEVQ
jgi:hypothetical protein